MFFYSKFIWGFADKVERIGSSEVKRVKVTNIQKEKAGANILKVVLKTEKQPLTLKITSKTDKIKLVKDLLTAGIALFDAQTLAQFKKSNIKLLMQIAAEITKNGAIDLPSKTLKQNAVYESLYHYTVHGANRQNIVLKHKLVLSDGGIIRTKYYPRTKIIRVSGVGFVAYVTKKGVTKGSIPKRIAQCLNYNIKKLTSITQLDDTPVIAHNRIITPDDKNFRIKSSAEEKTPLLKAE